jgi:hypothetical protein
MILLNIQIFKKGINLFSKIILLGFFLIPSLFYSQTLIHTQQFSSSNPAGWTTVSSASATNWSMTFNAGAGSACGGDTYHAKISAGASNDDYVITQGFSLTANYSYSITLNHKRTGTFDVYVGTAQTAVAMTGGTNIYSTTSDPSGCTDVSTSTFVPTTSGTYYFGFRVHTNSASTGVIDNIRIYETAPVTITWDGSSSTDWATAANWDLNRVPNSTDNIVVPSSMSNYPATVPSGSYNSLSITNGGSNFTTTINATSIASNLTILSSTTDNTVTIGSPLTVGGNISIGTSGSAFNFNCNASVTGSGTFSLGNSSTPITSIFASPISVTGAFSMGTNSSSSTTISYSNSSTPVISASNTGSYVFYGSVNYSASSGDQIVMKSQYNGALTASNGGNRFMQGNLDLNNNLSLTGGKWYCGSSETVTLGSGNSGDANQKDELSPYQGSSKSARWQMFIKPSEMAGMGANDLLTSLSLYVTTKRSTSAYQAFTIKLGHTTSTEFANSAPSFFLNDATTTVFNAQSVTTSAGWNTHIFDTPFTWDGSSTILVDISFFNTSPSASSGGIDAISVTTGTFGDDALIRAEGNTSQVAQTDGVDADDRPYTLFNSADGPFNINITNNWLNSGAEFYHLQNTVTFDGSSNQDVTTNGDYYYNFTVNNSSSDYALTLQDDSNIEGTGTLTDGVVNTGTNKLIVLSSTASKLTGYSNVSFIKGNLRRYVTTNTSTYGFPLGNGAATTNYFLSDIINNNLLGVAYLDSKFVSGLPSDYTQSSFEALGKEMSGTGVTQYSITALDSKGYTQIDPNSQPSGGDYSIKMYNTNYTLTSWFDNQQCIMKRSSSSAVLNDFNQAGTINADNGLGRMVLDGYLLSTGLTSFSVFIPGIVTIIALPIELVSFKATKLNQKQVRVLWETSSERNNDYFIIEKSLDGLSWNTIETVSGKKDYYFKSKYEIVDSTPMSEIVYYKLTQVDLDGKSNFFNPVSVDFIFSNENYFFVNLLGQKVDFDSAPSSMYFKIYESDKAKTDKIVK